MKKMLKQLKKATCMFLMGTLVIGMTQSVVFKGEVTQAANKNNAALKAYKSLAEDGHSGMLRQGMQP